MIVLEFLHLILVIGLAGGAVIAWAARPAGRRVIAFTAAVWLVGLAAVQVSLGTRGRNWLARPVPRFTFQRRPEAGPPLGSHHRLVHPPAEQRYPAAFRRLDRPVAVSLVFELQPDGRVGAVEAVRPSGLPDLDAALLAAVRRWRFGPLPAGHEPRSAETVRVDLANRRALLRRGRPAALLASAFVGIWLLALTRLRARGDDAWASPRALAGLSQRRMVLAAGWLGILGWLIVWRLGPDSRQSTQVLAYRQAWFLLFSVGTLAAAAAVTRRWAGFGRAVSRIGWLWVAGGVLLLLATRFTHLGTDLNTGHRLWLRTPLGVFQTVEIVKLMLVLFVVAAAYPASFGGIVTAQGRHTSVVRLRPWLERYRGVLGAFALVLATLTLMSDFGPLLLLSLVLLGLLFAQGHRRQSAIGIAALIALLAGSYLVGVPGRWQERVKIWRNPWQEAAGDSAGLRQGREHMARVLWAVSGGGAVGTGLGQGMPSDIAAVESDFMFAAISEELGWLGGATTLALLLALTVAGLSLAIAHADAFGKALLSGVAILLGAQAALNVGGNLGLWPLTGITLPFVSYGGSSLLTNALALGMCVGLARREGGTSEAAHPLPLEIGRRTNDSLRLLRVGFAALFALLAARAAWVQSPWTVDRAVRQHYACADGSTLGNPRRDAPAWVERGRFLDREGRPLAEPRHFVHLTGLEAPNRQRVGLESALNDILIGRLPPPRGSLNLLTRPRRPRGCDVVLTIDGDLQARAYELLRRGGHRGSIVAIAPDTGEVLVAANRPTLDARPSIAQWQASYDGRKGAPPFCYRRVYAPGSTFKTMVAAAALDLGVLSAADRVACRGSYRPPGAGRPVRDWQLRRTPGWRGHGRCTLGEALAPSCNSIFAEVGVMVGWRRLADFIDGAGLNRPLLLAPEEWRGGRTLWLEASQSVLTAGGKRPEEMPLSHQEPAALAHTALGQRDVRMTPLHLALWAAAIAHDGRMPAPAVVRAIRDDRGREVWRHEPRLHAQAMSHETAGHLTAMMEAAVEHGTGRAARIPGVRVAGKTGTPEEDADSSNAIFIGFAPVGRPQVAVAVVLEGARGGGGGAAAPIARELMRAMRRPEGDLW